MFEQYLYGGDGVTGTISYPLPGGGMINVGGQFGGGQQPQWPVSQQPFPQQQWPIQQNAGLFGAGGPDTTTLLIIGVLLFVMLRK